LQLKAQFERSKSYLLYNKALKNNLDATSGSTVKTSDYQGDFNMWVFENHNDGFYKIYNPRTDSYLDSNDPSKSNVYKTKSDSSYTYWKHDYLPDDGGSRWFRLINKQRTESGSPDVYLDSNREGQQPYCSKYRDSANVVWRLKKLGEPNEYTGAYWT